jgi:hypothetical protein
VEVGCVLAEGSAVEVGWDLVETGAVEVGGVVGADGVSAEEGMDDFGFSVVAGVVPGEVGTRCVVVVVPGVGAGE